MASEDEPEPEAAGIEAEAEEEEGDDALDPAAWAGIPDICGSCIAFRPEPVKDDDAVAPGTCKLRPEIGRIPASLKKCTSYMPRGAFRYAPGTIRTPTRRRSKLLSVTRHGPDGKEIRKEYPQRDLGFERPKPSASVTAPPRARAFDDDDDDGPVSYGGPVHYSVRADPEPRPAPPKTIDVGEESVPVFRQLLVEVVRQELGRSRRELHPKYKRGGQVLARSADGTHHSTMTAERFFVSLDRLKSAMDGLDRALKRHGEKLGPAELTELKDGLRAIAGSMTTFNLLFSDREDYFSSKE